MFRTRGGTMTRHPNSVNLSTTVDVGAMLTTFLQLMPVENSVEVKHHSSVFHSHENVKIESMSFVLYDSSTSALLKYFTYTLHSLGDAFCPRLDSGPTFSAQYK